MPAAPVWKQVGPTVQTQQKPDQLATSTEFKDMVRHLGKQNIAARAAKVAPTVAAPPSASTPTAVAREFGFEARDLQTPIAYLRQGTDA
jgi:hypothetical protein